MSRISWSELFPTNLSFVIFVSYILLFSIQGILVTATQGDHNEYAYNVTTVVILTELVKLIASIGLYCKDNSVRSLFNEFTAHWKLLALYLIPAFLYSLYNNLAFKNLSQFDPTTYNILLQFRVVVTAILFQIIFNRKLNRKQWFSLVLLTAGCVIKESNFADDASNLIRPRTAALTPILLIFVQMLCSCFAGVYTEHLLKSTSAEVNFFAQNVFMYFDSILCNVTLLLICNDFTVAFSRSNLTIILSSRVSLVVLNSAVVGIVTSFFLKKLNSILKIFAGSLELVLVALFAYVFLSVPIRLNTVISICTVLIAVYLYSQNPVTNSGRLTKQKTKELRLQEV